MDPVGAVGMIIAPVSNGMVAVYFVCGAVLTITIKIVAMVPTAVRVDKIRLAWKICLKRRSHHHGGSDYRSGCGGRSALAGGSRGNRMPR